MTDPPEDLGGVRLFAGVFRRLNLFAVFAGSFARLLAVLVSPHFKPVPLPGTLQADHK